MIPLVGLMLGLEEAGDGFALVDAVDGFGEEGGDGEGGDFVPGSHGGAVGADEFFDVRVC